MSVTYFIADLHLSPERPDITACLKAFLAHQGTEAEALYVLGDLFESWIGDDDITPFNAEVADMFAAFAASGKPVYFIRGNRDFMLGEAFCQRAGMTLLPEQQVIDLYGTPTVILHGDELCTLDKDYQRFRKTARSWWWPRLMLALPLWVRRRIAGNIRKTSYSKQQRLSLEIMDVTPQAVCDTFKKHGVRQMIHGHTHRPNIHVHDVNGQPAKRIVLGDWYEQGSMLRVSDEELQLVALPL